jgi:2-iminobutanoate/2-iminopropanoate deaminase
MHKEIIKTDKAPAAIGPYSQAVRSGDLLFCSGQIALIAETGELDTADIKTETHRVMQNIGNLLAAAGLNYSNIIKTTIFMADMADYASINEVYASYFTSDYPAREAVAVKTLPKNVAVEITVTAAF